MNVRFARPTDRLHELEQFYCTVLGLTNIGEFRGHDGYDGVMLAYPGTDWHLEFTSRSGNVAPSCPSAEHLLVLYLDREEFSQSVGRLQRSNVKTVPAENPYWEKHGALTIEDPDGYRIVLFPA